MLRGPFSRVSRPRRAAALLAAMLWLPAAARAQTNSGSGSAPPPPTPTPAQIEQAVKESGLSRAQLLEKARELQAGGGGGGVGAGKADTTSPPPAVKRSPASS